MPPCRNDYRYPGGELPPKPPERYSGRLTDAQLARLNADDLAYLGGRLETMRGQWSREPALYLRALLDLAKRLQEENSILQAQVKMGEYEG